MSFAAPWMLWWGLLAVPVVVLYVLKVRVRRVPVSTLMFWERVYEEKAPRSLWERLRHLSSLLLQLALLALLVIALADPVFDWEAKSARHVVLIVDNSASMQATDALPSRLDAAKQKAHDLLDGLRPRDEMAVMSAGTRPQVVVGMTSHAGTLKDAVIAIPATDGPTRVTEAVDLARRLISRKSNGQIIVLSDAAFDGADGAVTASDVTWLPVGGRTRNIGITQFQVRRSLIDPIGYELLAEVSNSTDEPVEARLDLELAGEVVDAIPLKLEPRQVWRRTFQKASATGGELLASLTFPKRETASDDEEFGDALAVDNRARAILPARDPQPVFLVTEGNLFLESVFRASPFVELTVVPEQPAERPENALVVFHQKVPSELPRGNVLVIDPQSSTQAWQVGQKNANPVVAKQSEESPLLAHVKLRELVFPEARHMVVRPELKADVLAETTEGDPLLFAYRQADQKVLVLTVDLNQGDLPLRTAYPILLTNALAWYAEGAGELREAYPAGSLAAVKVDPRKRYALHSPDGATKTLPTANETVTIGPLDQAGLWRVVPAVEKAEPSATVDANEAEVSEWPEGTLTIACNLADRGETDLAPRTERAGALELSAAGWAGRPMWFYLLIGVAFLIPAEWLLYQRRWIQ